MTHPVEEQPRPDLTAVVRDHEVRLVRLETKVESELSGIRSHLRDQQTDIRQNKVLAESIQSQISLLTKSIGELQGSQRALLWILGMASVVIAGLEAWAIFRG